MTSDILKKTMIFCGMNQEEIEAAMTELHAIKKTYRKRDTILHAGSQTDSVCLVISGSVSIESNDMWGNRTLLNMMSTGDFFAETYAILNEESMLVDAVANENCEILFLRIHDLLDTADHTEIWQNKLIRNLLMISTHKNLMLSGRSFHISPKSVRGRIMAYLNSVSLRKHGKIFDIPFDRQQMADYLNLERTALSKELGRMKKEGIIDFHKNHFKIL